MKSLDEILEQKDLLLSTDRKEHTPAQVKRIVNRISFLSICERYLLGNPSPIYVKSEISRIHRRIGLVSDSFLAWIPDRAFKSEKEKLTAYYKMHDVPKLKTQLKALNFLLDE